VKDREIDELLKGAKVPQDPEAETLERIAGSIAESMRATRPLPSRRILGGVVALICAAVALAGAAGLGFSGFVQMSLLERCAVFSALGILILATASELVSAMIPASRRRCSAVGLLAIAGLSLAAIMAASFRDYHTTNFLHAGLVCLAVGLLHAIPAGLLSWLVLRRGFAVDSISAGLVAGTLAGLAGVGMLELHCPNFQAAHVLVWHLGALLVSAGLGALCGWAVASTLRNQRIAASGSATDRK
jgi:hypothetical protein